MDFFFNTAVEVHILHCQHMEKQRDLVSPQTSIYFTHGKKKLSKVYKYPGKGTNALQQFNKVLILILINMHHMYLL